MPVEACARILSSGWGPFGMGAIGNDDILVRRIAQARGQFPCRAVRGVPKRSLCRGLASTLALSGQRFHGRGS